MPCGIRLGQSCVSCWWFSLLPSDLISIYTVFVLSYAHLTKILTGFPATTRDVFMRITNLTWISWNRGTWKAHFLSKYVVFLFCISYLVFSQVYKSIFTSPSSANNILDEENDAENVAPTKSQKISSNKTVRRNVASKLHLNDRVTPRSVAYAAVQVCVYVTVFYVVLDLSVAASSISTCKLRVLGLQFMVDLTTLDYITMLSISLRIPRGLQQKSAPRSYSTGGQCECFRFSQILD